MRPPVRGQLALALPAAVIANLRARCQLFGLSLDDLERILRKQDICCAVCRKRFTRRRQVQIDHDPATHTVRGLLCVACRAGLKLLGADPVVVRSAATYLEDHYP